MTPQRIKNENQREPLVLLDDNAPDDFLRIDDERNVIVVWARQGFALRLMLSREKAIAMRDWLNKWIEKAP